MEGKKKKIRNRLLASSRGGDQVTTIDKQVQGLVPGNHRLPLRNGTFLIAAGTRTREEENEKTRTRAR